MKTQTPSLFGGQVSRRKTFHSHTDNLRMSRLLVDTYTMAIIPRKQDCMSNNHQSALRKPLESLTFSEIYQNLQFSSIPCDTPLECNHFLFQSLLYY